jgi:hypothetical protein
MVDAMLAGIFGTAIIEGSPSAARDGGQQCLSMRLKELAFVEVG